MEDRRSQAGRIEHFIREFHARLLDELARGRLGEIERRRRVARLLDGHVEFTALGVLLLGSRWRSGTSVERAQFCAALRDNLAHTLVARVEKSGERRLHIAAIVWSGTMATAVGELSGRHGDPVAVDWHVVGNGLGKWRLANVTIAGMSLASILRARFDAVLDESQGLSTVVALLRGQHGERPL